MILSTWIIVAALVLLLLLLLLIKRESRYPIRLEKILVKSVIQCMNCGLKVVRNFENQDYVFKPCGRCPSCGGDRYIVAIYGQKIKSKSS